MIYVGIDPGLTGAVAAIDARGQFIMVDDMPVMASGKAGTKVQRQVDPLGLRSLIQWMRTKSEDDIVTAAIERVSAMPGQGVASMFSLGDSFGCIRAVVAGMLIPTVFPSPASWKKLMGMDADKERSRAKAIQLFPAAAGYLARKKDHNRAEAVLLAEYLRRSVL